MNTEKFMNSKIFSGGNFVGYHLVRGILELTIKNENISISLVNFNIILKVYFTINFYLKNNL